MDDQQLCEGIAAGDPGAFEELYAMHGRRLLGAVARLLGEYGVRDADDAAEDVVYGLFAKWFAKPPTIESSGLRGFLGTSVRNACVDYLRRDRRQTGNAPRGSADVAKPDGRRNAVLPAVPGETAAER